MSEFVKLSDKQKVDFNKVVKELRGKLITKPKETVSKIILQNNEFVDRKLESGDISGFILFLRQQIFEFFLKEEKQFNNQMFVEISKRFELPRQKINQITEELQILKLSEITATELNSIISERFGAYAGEIFPYIYDFLGFTDN